MKLTTKLVAFFLSIAIIPLSVVGYISYNSGQQIIKRATLDHLVFTTTHKEAELNQWLEEHAQQLQELVERPAVREHATALTLYSPTDPAYQVARRILLADHLNPTEKTYLVNKFGFFVIEPGLGENLALRDAVDTAGVADCLAHNDGVGFYKDYRGVPVIGVYRWMPEREVCILTEVDQVEAFAPVVALRNTALGIGIPVA
jgi:hypothetical protein